MVIDFFKNLVRSKVEGARASAVGKGMGAQAKIKGKVAGGFNKAVDGAKKKGVNAAKGVKGKKDKKDKDKDKKMGLFGKKKDKGGGGHAPEPINYAEDSGAKTVAISIEGLTEERSQRCVGWIVAMNGDMEGTDFRLVPGKNIIGTSADCDIVLTDSYLSSKHATIRFEDDEYAIVDLDSTNGTFVNGKRTSKSILIDNDTVRLGKLELRFKALY